MKYLARKYGLLVDNAQDLARQDMLEANIIDIRNRLIISVYHKSYSTDKDFELELDAVRQDLAVALGQLEQWISDRKFLIGDQLTYVDFLAYEYLDWYRVLVQSDCFAKYPKMEAYMKRFEELEQLKDYLASDQYRNGNCTGPYAKFDYGSQSCNHSKSI